MFDRYLIPISPYLFISAGLVACLYFFLALQRELRDLRARLGKRDAQIDASAQDLLAQIVEMRVELRDAEQRTAQLVPPAAPVSGLNLNTRTKVLRMLRSGEAEDQIAARLGLPRKEVALVAKVQRLTASRLIEATALEPEPRPAAEPRDYRLTSSSAAC